jgi:hypothetical protein
VEGFQFVGPKEQTSEPADAAQDAPPRKEFLPDVGKPGGGGTRLKPEDVIHEERVFREADIPF